MIVRAYARVHMCLIDMNGSLGRVDGGIGFALEQPFLQVNVKKADDISVSGELSKKAREAAEAFFRHYGIEGGAEIKVEKAYPEHVGLGSGTQISLSVVSALARIYGIEASVRELAHVAGRGGTSGIGTAAFELGGFILDGGHSTREKPEFLPSRASRAKPAPLLLRMDFPDWDIAIILPKEHRRVSGKKEVNIFKEFCPVPVNHVERLSRLILMKLLPAIAEEDIEGFGEAVNEIQKLGFKYYEVLLQSPEVRECLSIAQRHSYGAGLSSFGPVIYAVVREKDELLEALRGKADIIFTKVRNRGAEIEAD